MPFRSGGYSAGTGCAPKPRREGGLSEKRVCRVSCLPDPVNNHSIKQGSLQIKDFLGLIRVQNIRQGLRDLLRMASERNRVDKLEKVDLYKQSATKFIFSEFAIFISQVFVFFMVAVFTSNFLNSEEKLVSFLEQKINDRSFVELGLTFLAISMVIGLLSALGRIFDNKYVEYYVNEILCEMPKTIYVFGSAATGALLALSLFAHLHPTEEVNAKGFAGLSAFFALVVFIYGCGFSYAFKRKTHILRKPNN